jgi:transposase
VINVALLSVIRRWHLREQMSIRDIARRTGLSRNTIRKYLANGVVEPRYPKRKSRSTLDPFAEKLTDWLQVETTRGRKQRLGFKKLYLRLRQLGNCGSYDRVCAFARRWRSAPQEAARTVDRGVFVPLGFAAGDAFQFD